MFRDAAAIDRQATDRRIAALTERYDANAESWFDGSPDSVDRRIAACDQLLTRARAAAVRLGYQEGYTEIVADLESDRRSLTDLREALLNGASDREMPTRTAAPISKEDYLNFARSQNKDPRDMATVGLYSMVTGAPLEQLADFTHIANRRTAAGGWGDVDIAGAEGGGGQPFGPGTFDHYLEYSYRNGLQPNDRLTVDRYSREHGVPQERAFDFANQFGTNKRSHLTAAQYRSVELESRTFLADNADCVGYTPELLYRARRYAEDKTSTLSPQQSRRYVTAFVARVEQLGRQVPRRQASRPATRVTDFPAELMYD